MTQTSKFSSALPVTADEFAGWIEAFILSPPSRRLAVAVSGGPDSMALAYCVTRWAGNKNLLALIVDHDLRSESAAEADNTSKQLSKLGIASEILRWDHAPVLSKLHATARKARYALLIEACHRHDMSDLLLAHQREDQAETIMMRFAKGSGIDGLCGMDAESLMDNIRIVRPFLYISKERLIATCTAAHISCIADPSNKSEKFARGRLRRVLPLLAKEGLTLERLIDLGVRAAEARDALDHYAHTLLRTATTISEAGVIFIDLKMLRAAPRATSLRALSLCLQHIHVEDYAPERASLLPLLAALCAEADMEPRTLQGCLISKNKTRVIIMREYAAITDAPIIRSGETTIWDGRWWVTLARSNSSPLEGEVKWKDVRLGVSVERQNNVGNTTSNSPPPFLARSSRGRKHHPTPPQPAHLDSETFVVGPLGNPPHEVLDLLAPNLRDKVPQGRIRACLPALWRGGDLVLIPSLAESGFPASAQLAKSWF